MNDYEMNEKIGQLLGYKIKRIGGWYILFYNDKTVIIDKKLSMTYLPAYIASIFPNWSGNFELCYRDLNIENHTTKYYTSSHGAIVIYENEITGSKTSFAANVMTPLLICQAFLSMNGFE